MKLKDWRTQEGRTQQWVADQLNRLAGEEGAGLQASQSAVDRWEKGTIPRRANLTRLAKLTGGKVTIADFYGETGALPRRRARAAAVSIAASRKGAATRRGQREVRS